MYRFLEYVIFTSCNVLCRPGNGIVSVFFLCVKVTKTCVLLSWHVAVQRSVVRPTLRDVMMMYFQTDT